MTEKDVFYFVEGNCEAVLVDVLTKKKILVNGKPKVINLSQRKFPQSLLLSMKYGSCAVFIFDTDVGNPKIAQKNIELFLSSTTGVDLIVIPQCRNLEDELKYVCSLKEIRHLTKSKSNSDFKRDFIRAKNPEKLLDENGFDFNRLWNRKNEADWEILRSDNINKIIKKTVYKRNIKKK